MRIFSFHQLSKKNVRSSYLISLHMFALGDIETNIQSFASKWQTKDSCDHLSDKIVVHPCQVNVERRAAAETICSKLRDKLFAECHLFVEPEEFYEDCMYDVCACKGSDVSNCFCPIIASYAAECARKGVVVNDWRYRIPECGECFSVHSRCSVFLWLFYAKRDNSDFPLSFQPSTVPTVKCLSNAVRSAKAPAMTFKWTCLADYRAPKAAGVQKVKCGMKMANVSR